jgi:hypothetical protein
MATSGLSIGHSDAPRRHHTPEVREALHDNVSRARMATLAVHKNPDVRAAVAARADCPLGLMISLAHDAKADVRLAVAANERAAFSVLEQLARDRDPRVAKAVVHNVAAPKQVVEALGFHRDASVRRIACIRLDDPEGFVAALTGEVAVTPELEEAASGEDASAGAVRDPEARVLAPRPQVGRSASGAVPTLEPEGSYEADSTAATSRAVTSSTAPSPSTWRNRPLPS